MPEIDEDWVAQQLSSARVQKRVGDSVVRLLAELESSGLTDKARISAVDVFSKLALGQPIVVKKDDRKWVPVTPGAIKVADRVRVKSDAFSGRLGPIHNGREGVVVAVRYGDVVVKTTDGQQPNLDGAHYPPDKLEKLVAV